MVSISGVTVDLNPSRIKTLIHKLQTKVGTALSTGAFAVRRVEFRCFRVSSRWLRQKIDPLASVANRLRNAIGRRCQSHLVKRVFSKSTPTQRLHKLDDLGMVSGFATQELEG